MSDNVTNELILEHPKALQADSKNAQMERKEIRDELRPIKGHIVALVQSDLNSDRRLDRIERRLEITEN